jgi:hypothetical protein
VALFLNPGFKLCQPLPNNCEGVQVYILIENTETNNVWCWLQASNGYSCSYNQTYIIVVYFQCNVLNNTFTFHSNFNVSLPAYNSTRNFFLRRSSDFVNPFCLPSFRMVNLVFTSGWNGVGAPLASYRDRFENKRHLPATWLETLKMEAVNSSEITTNIYQTTRLHIIEDNTLHCHHHEVLKANKYLLGFRIWICHRGGYEQFYILLYNAV